ncbi:MAG: hypothetical protein JWR52_3274 [Marmoricola sp.]|nr:hypothetical protein [Marmoricola sp.]
MRRLTAAVAALGVALGLTLVVTGSAQAALTAPANGAVVAGNITLQDSGVSDGSLCVNGTKPNVTLSLINSANVTVFSQNIQSTSAVSSSVIDTHTLPNGAYTARAVEQKRSGTIFCSNSSTTINNAITIQNVTNIALSTSTPGSVPQNTSLVVSATLVDPNLGTQVLPGRSVSFTLSGGTTVVGTTDATGVATVTLPITGPPRPGATITASFAATAFYTASSSVRSIDVTQNSTATTLAQPADVVHGQATSFSATVAATNGTGTPTGTVQFKVDGTNFGSAVTLVAGAASSGATSTLSTGAHAITAVYSGDPNFLGSTSAAKNQQVNKAATTTGLTDAPSPTVSGQAVVFTATVGVTGAGAGSPTGAVQFNIDGQPFGTAVPLSGNTATLSVSNLSTGNHNVVAVYNGDGDFSSSSSATITHGVNKADSNLSMTTSDAGAVAGEPLTFTANVTAVGPGVGTPGGTVQFAVDGVNLGAPVPLVGGQASSPVAHLDAGSHNVTANYAGDTNFGGSNNSLTQAVIAAHTTTTVTSSPNPSVFGQSVQVHAEVTPVSPATGNPIGAVQFIVDGNPAGAFAVLSGGQADATLTGLSVGDHTITAKYLSGDENFITSTSAPLTQTVNKASTTTSLVSNAPNSVFGQPVTFTASVSVVAPGAGSPSGTIVFTDGATVIGTQPVNSSTGEQASITVSNLTVAQHAITATYSGDGNFNPSNGSVVQKVTRALTSTVVASSANPAQNGQAVQFTATVSPVAPGAGNPSGTVQFTVNGVPLGGGATIVNGVATSTSFASLTPGKYTVSAAYSGDGNFVASTGVLDEGTGQTITQGSTSMTVTAGPNPSAYGGAVTVTSTVSAVAPATGKPTGVVQIWEGSELLGATSLAPSSTAGTSVATFVTSDLSSGAHALQAVYVGNYNFTGATAATSETVSRAPSVSGIASSVNPAVYGDPVTFTATVSSVGGTPTGSVTFKEGSTVLGTATLANAGANQTASVSVAGLHAGTHNVVAVYDGDTSTAGSTSPAFSEIVTAAPVNLFAADVNNPADPLPPKNGYIRALLTDRFGNPLAGQTIRFDSTAGPARPSKHLCDAVTDASGIAECSDTVISIDLGLAPGDQLLDVHGTYDATFAGTADFQPATSRGHEYGDGTE